MTSQVSIPNYDVSKPLWQPYTGTECQPETVSIFYKCGNGQDKIEIYDEEIVNSLGHSPVNFISAIERIQSAAKEIFEILKYGPSEFNDDLPNAFMNLGRGIVQLVPLAGNGVLYIFDKIRTHFFYHSQIKAALANENETVVGIAFDGKIIAKFNSEKLKTADNPLPVASVIWAKLVINGLEKNLPKTRLQLVDTFKKVLATNY